MRIALAWKPMGDPRSVPDPQEVARRLASRFAPLFGDKEPEVRLRGAGTAHLATLELPVAGWTPPFFEEDEHGFAFAPDYPLNAARFLEGRRARNGRTTLLGLGAGLARDPAPLLRELVPPFSMVWGDTDEDALFVQTDGLGQGQWLEVENARLWAVTNRIGALAALEVPLRPVPDEWAVRFTLGWFTEFSTGYEGVRLLPPGVQVRVDARGVQHRTEDVLREWVHPEPRSETECLELACASMENLLVSASACWTNASVGLSGGWDSRAVASILRKLDVPFELRVRGHPGRLDVMVANQLARMAGLPIRIKHKGGVPPETADECRASIERALLWQGGHMTALKHKTFLVKRKTLGGGVVNVMGQHSGTVKGDFAVRIGADELEPERYEDELVESLMKDAPPMLHDDVRERVRERIRAAYRQAERYDMDGLHPLHFFFIYEYTRRWGAATVNAQTGLVVAPFLNPDMIRAAYAFPPERIPEKAFHSFITRRNAPDWAEFPYENQVTMDDVRSGTIPPADLHVDIEKDLPPWRRRRWGKYDQKIYWQMVGQPLVEEALASEGWWREIFDPTAAARDWSEVKGAADALVIAHLLPDR